MELNSVTFDILSQDKSQKESWGFYRLRMTLVVDKYQKFVKVPGRRGWICEQHWSRLYGRDNNIKREDIPLDDAVTATAQREFVQLAETVSVGFQD